MKCCYNDQISFREGSFYGLTKSICPECHAVVEGKYIFSDGKVYLTKRCLEHGEFKTLISSDMDYWVKSLSFTKPGQIPFKFSTSVDKGCPEDCGLCDDHQQHTCSPIIEISNKCDLECPICIVWNKNDYDISFDDFKNIIDGLIEKEGELELVLLSGGEPTLHPEFFKLVDYVKSKSEINRVLISSHGLKIARDDEFAKRFKEAGIYLSLQFDSLEASSYVALRGKNLLEEKKRCLEQCKKYDIPTIIVPTIARGFNDHEIGAIVDFAFSYDVVTSVTLQPAAYTGKGGSDFPIDGDKLTHVDIHKLLAEQTSWLNKDDFLPIPCSHPSCYTATYLLKSDDNEFTPLTRFGNLDSYLDALTNKAVIDGGDKTADLIQDASYNLWSAQAITVDSDKVLKSLKSIVTSYQKSSSDDKLKKIRANESKIKALFIHAFMDENDFDVSRLKKCCTHYALPDGRLMPGCSYNNIHRFRDQRLGLDLSIKNEDK